MTIPATLSVRLVPASGSMLVSHDPPLRIFILSNRRLLREVLARVLRSEGGIPFVRSEKFSLSAIAEVVDSACDTLLVDPLNMAVLYSSIVHHLPSALPHLKVIAIDMEANIDDLLSEIFAAHTTCDD